MPLISKAKAFAISAYLAAVVSVTLAYWLLAFEALTYVLFHFRPPMGRTWRSFVFDLTEPYPAVLVTACIVSATLAGPSGTEEHSGRVGKGQVGSQPRPPDCRWLGSRAWHWTSSSWPRCSRTSGSPEPPPREVEQ